MSSGGGLVKIAGVDKGTVREMLDIEVDDAAWKAFTSRKNAALLGVDFARDPAMRKRYVWKEGEEFVLADMGGMSVYFAGTFEPRDPTLRSIILTGDRFLMEVDDRLGTANQILVKIRHRDDADRIVEAINALPFPTKIHAERNQDVLDQAISKLDLMLRYAFLVIVVVGVVILIGLANATSMAVRERVSEVALLRTLGFTRIRVVGLVAGESLLLALLGGALGCAAAWLAVTLGGVRLTSGGFAFPVTLSALLLLVATAAAAAVGILGGLPAGIRVSRRPIVEALRSVDG
jgi:putative ABC transport system permease protein